MIAGSVSVAAQENQVPVVPIPVKTRLTEGAAFQVTPTTVIVCRGDAADIKAVGDRAVEAFRRVTGDTLKINPRAGMSSNSHFDGTRRERSGRIKVWAQERTRA